MRALETVREETVESLLARWRDHGDAPALGRLFDRTAPALFRIALSVAPDAAIAEEAVQETFLAVLEEPRRCDPGDPVMPWLVSVLRHKVLDARRRDRRVPDPLRLSPRILPEDPADAAGRRDAVDRVRRALDRLQEPYRTVALLRWEYGLEPGEIAHARNEPPGTVRSTLSRALERLRRDLGGGAALALVLGARPPDGLAAIRRTVLAKAAGGSAAAAGAGLVVGGVLVTKSAAAATLIAAFILGTLAGGGAVSSLRPADPAPPALPERRPEPGPDAEVAPREPAPPPAASAEMAVPAPTAPGEGADVAARAEANRLLDSLDGDWRKAEQVGKQLARMEPAEVVFDVVRVRWSGIPDFEDRRHILKSYRRMERLLDLLDLGACDPDPRVQSWAFIYLAPFAGRDFADEGPEAYAEWRRETRSVAITAILDEAATTIRSRLSSASAEELGAILYRLRDVNRLQRPGPEARAATCAALEPVLRALPPPDARDALLQVLIELKPSEDFQRAHLAPMLDGGLEEAAFAGSALGWIKPSWAADVLIPRLEAQEPARVVQAAEALGALGSPRGAAPLMDLLRRAPATDVERAATASLARIGSVAPPRDATLAWWEEWWTRNRARFEQAAPERGSR